MEEDEILQQPSLVLRKPEGDRVPQAGIDAVTLPIVPVLDRDLVREERDLEENASLRGEPEVFADGRAIEAELIGEPAVRDQGTDVREEGREQGMEATDVPDGVGEDDIALDDAVEVCGEEVGADRGVGLERSAGEAAGDEILAEPVDQVVVARGEGEGIIGPSEGAKPREVLVDSKSYLKDKERRKSKED